MSKKGIPMRKRGTPCTMCGATVLRAAHFSDAKCPPCQRKHETARYNVYLKATRQEARRYRILMAVSPYETYEELYRALKIRNPKDRYIRYAMAVERRTE